MSTLGIWSVGIIGYAFTVAIANGVLEAIARREGPSRGGAWWAFAAVWPLLTTIGLALAVACVLYCITLRPWGRIFSATSDWSASLYERLFTKSANQGEREL